MQINPRKIRRLTVITLLVLTAVISAIIGIVAFEAKQWETLTSVMAVIAALLAIWSSLSLTWQQEDDREPQILIFIDNLSHKYAYSLIAKNIGGSPAYNVKIEWASQFVDFENKPPRFTEFENEYDFEYFPQQMSYSRFLIGSDDFKRRAKENDAPLVYKGIVSYSFSAKSNYRIKQEFKISFEAFKRRLNVENDQMDFYFENKKVSEHLKKISQMLERLADNSEQE